MDPWTEQSTLARRDLDLRWVDTRSALILPAGDVARLVVLDITPVEPALVAWAGLAPEKAIAQGEVVPRGGMEVHAEAPLYYDPAYTVYRLEADALAQQVASGASTTSAGADPFAPTLLARQPSFGGLVQLVGYQWLTEPVPGGPAQLLTFWLARDVGPRSSAFGEPALRTFLHLLDGDNVPVAGVDVLGAAPDRWVAGDVVVQLHAFDFPSEKGEYAVELGWYVPPDGPRLPVDGIDAPGERVLLAPVEVQE
jgi:hypothetical protein